ncbi:ATP-binding protein [Pseudolysinimonas sp.]|uniref:ATP-binding protein n=1 Tax=Pseudolysinimonas sp. TaxID=2680009 RepID=UPI003F822FED
MAEYRERVIDKQIAAALSTFGAVILEGPRAVGKTTTALQHAASSVRLDSSPDLVTLAETSPDTVLAGETPRLVDEWQLAPTLWNAVRHAVDVRHEAGQFVLTGSATPSDDATRHSGAGRFRRLTLRPMTLSESGESTGAVLFSDLLQPGAIAGLGGPDVEEYARLIVRGGWPALLERPGRSATDYLSAYLDDVSRTDLALVDTRVDPIRMRALMRALARNVSTEVAAARLATEAELGDAGSLSAQTVRKYLDALTRVKVVEEQPAWAPHLRSATRLRVSPTWHFIDPSLAAAALGASPRALIDDPATLGFLFESLVIRDLRVYADTLGGAVLHYRDGEGLEVDAIVDLPDGRWAAFEIKLGGQANIDAASASLRKLAARVSEQRAASLAGLVVVTAGKTSLTRPDGVKVVSLGHLTAA